MTTTTARLIIAVAGILGVAAVVTKLIDVVASENRRLLSAAVAQSPKDYGVLAAQQDTHEAAPAPVERVVREAMRDIDEHIAGLTGDDTPNLPYGL